MANLEKVIKGLERCAFGVSDPCYENDCPYYQSHDCTDELKNDILALLKEQENDYKKILSDYRYLTREYIKLLNKRIPLITNGQEVIQCKDCKHWKKSTGHCPYNSIFTVDDWFCADGERREDND